MNKYPRDLLRLWPVSTRIGDEPWVDLTRRLAQQLKFLIQAVVIGPGREFEDVYGGWAATREIEESGCLPVRPDQFVAFRQAAVAQSAEDLRVAWKQILGPIDHRRRH
jgi:2,4-dichlorophenol 6-monooxygenase